MDGRKGFALLPVLLVVLGVAVIGGIVFFDYKAIMPQPTNSSPTEQLPSQTPSEKVSSTPIVQNAQTYFNQLNHPSHGFSASSLIELQWNISKIANNTSATLSVDCQAGVIFFDMLRYQLFECGDVARPVGQAGAANIYVINKNPAPIQITATLHYGSGSFVTTSSIAATPPVTGEPSVTVKVNGGSGPINAGEGSVLATSWTSTGVLNCFNYEGEVGTSAVTTFPGGAHLPGPVSGTGIIELISMNRPYAERFGVACITPIGSIVSSSVQINVSPSSFNVVASPGSPNPEKISSNGKHQLLGSFDITAGSNPVTMTSLWIDGSVDVASSGMSISNLEVAVTPQGSSAPDLFNNLGARVHSDINILLGTSTILANGKAKLQIYGDVVDAQPGTYKTPFTINGIQGYAVGSPGLHIFLYNGNMNGKISGQDVLVSR